MLKSLINKNLNKNEYCNKRSNYFSKSQRPEKFQKVLLGTIFKKLYHKS